MKTIHKKIGIGATIALLLLSLSLIIQARAEYGGARDSAHCGEACNLCNMPGDPITDDCDTEDVANCGADGAEGWYSINDIHVLGNFKPGGFVDITSELFVSSPMYNIVYYATGWQDGVKLNEFGCYEVSGQEGYQNYSFGSGYTGDETGFGTDTTISGDATEGEYHIRATISYGGIDWLEMNCDKAGLGNGWNEEDNDYCEEGNFGENDGVDITITERYVCNDKDCFAPRSKWDKRITYQDEP